MTKFQRTVETVAAYKDIVEHAEALGFEPVDHYFTGVWNAEYVKKNSNESWSDVDGLLCWPQDCEVLDTTQKYFEVEMDGDRSRISSGGGDLIVTFQD